MSEYGPGLTIGKMGELDKERVRHALSGELVCGESERGFEYAPAPREECEAYVLSVVDHWVYQAKELADSARAMERVMESNGFYMANHMREFMAERARASREFDDYVYEHERDALLDEAESALGGGCE